MGSFGPVDSYQGMGFGRATRRAEQRKRADEARLPRRIGATWRSVQLRPMGAEPHRRDLDGMPERHALIRTFWTHKAMRVMARMPRGVRGAADGHGILRLRVGFADAKQSPPV